MFKKLTEEQKKEREAIRAAKKEQKRQDKQYAKYFKYKSKHHFLIKVVAVIIIAAFVIPVFAALWGQSLYY